MSVTYIDPPGPLTNTTEPIDFTTDNLVTSISVEFSPDTGRGSRETVWDGTSDTDDTGGDFSYAYRNSSHSDLTGAGPYSWTVRRNTRWPADFRIRVKESGVSGEGPSPEPERYPALTPTAYSPVAQYALQGHPDLTRVYLDRSGNGLHLTKGAPTGAVDLIPGQKCIVPTNGTTNSNRLQRIGAQTALQITGDLTVTGRVNVPPGAAGPLVCMSGIFGSGNTRNTLYTCSILANGSMEVFWEVTAGVSTTRQSSVGFVPDDTWVFVSFRREASTGRWTFGVNTSYETSTTGPGTSGGSEAFLSIGDHDESSLNTFFALIADVSIWNVRLSDAELLPLYKTVMGV